MIGSKYLAQELVGDALDLALVVGGLAGEGQGLLVHVGGVDLDLFAELVEAQDLGHDHGDGVGLLARGAAGTPDADRLVGLPGRDESGHDLGLEDTPRRRGRGRRR